MTDFEIVLNQIDIGLGITQLTLVVFDTKKNLVLTPPNYDWQVQYPNYDLDQSPVFALQLRPPQKMVVDLNNPDPFVNSHFFNITAAHPPPVTPPETFQSPAPASTEALPVLAIAAVATPEITSSKSSKSLSSTQLPSSTSSASASSSLSSTSRTVPTIASLSYSSMFFRMPISASRQSITTKPPVTSLAMNISTSSSSSILARKTTTLDDDVPKSKALIPSSSLSGSASLPDVPATTVIYSTISASNIMSSTSAPAANAQRGKSHGSSKGSVAGIVLGTILGASVILGFSAYVFWRIRHKKQEDDVRIDHEEGYSDLKPLRPMSLPTHPIEPFELDSATSPTELPDERWEQRPVELC
ncbi:hypothetical protein BJ875DRAFT_444492 [Amylocarpus encephaloides]|uniref:Mid2 domain-containing protein n=1 Tax=Amylocarpus encephaloides TaxID=45428 RepID=A0A9P7YCW1_9HELO|nr:hypothetical protein BJ875DRAFT_444492 [Amylocarpus encephaloides]